MILRSSRSTHRGVSSVEFGAFVALLLVLVIVVASLSTSRLNAQEITAGDYAFLGTLAKQSCSGQAVLKQKAVSGPIMRGDAVRLRDELQRLADSQTSSAARAKIAAMQTTCS